MRTLQRQWRLKTAFFTFALTCQFVTGLAGAATAPDAEPQQKSVPLASCPSAMGSLSLEGSLPQLPVTLTKTLRPALEKRLGPVSSICRTPFGLLEVVADGEFYYVDERGNYLLKGNAFDLRTHENLTTMREDDVLRVDLKALPLDLAIKTVRGKGARQLVIFEDPNCPYCKRFEKDIATLDNATIYTFLYPILSRDRTQSDDSYAKSRAVWCGNDRAAAWSQLMLEGKRLPVAPDACDAPLERILQLGRSLHMTATPTLVFADGRRVPGAISLDDVKRAMADAAQGSRAAH